MRILNPNFSPPLPGTAADRLSVKTWLDSLPAGTPSVTFDELRQQFPFLGAIPDGDLEELARGAGYVVEP